VEGTRFPILLGGIIVFFGIAHGVVQWQGSEVSGRGLGVPVSTEYQYQQNKNIQKLDDPRLTLGEKRRPKS